MNSFQNNLTTIDPVVIKDQSAFLSRVFGWMALALFISAGLAYFVAGSVAVQQIVFGSPLIFFGLMIAELGLVIYLSAKITKMSVSAAKISFFLYAALNGLTLSAIFLAYTASSIAGTFIVSAATFGVMALYGYITKRDLTSWGHLLMMFLFGIIIAGIVNIFIQSTTLYWTTTVIGIGLFVGLTAYDTQRIKNMSIGNINSPDEQKGAILGALILYLDFINLFLFVLRIFGKRK
ncbi:MAG: ybhL [Candidatus Doudnabacteria bacterium]|nr:ybhL [Candidatus Doudnabacteria bacterium]